MAEVVKPLQVVRVTYTCDKCGEGEMESTGVKLTCYPPLYPHRCNKCDAHANFEKVYPCTEYRSAE